MACHVSYVVVFNNLWGYFWQGLWGDYRKK